jgi:hypothetical protein
MRTKMVSVFLCFALFASAALPIATITAGGNFKLSGVMVPASAAASVPAGSGDEISAMNVPVVVRFGDQGVITLDPGSKVKIEEQGGKIVIRLLSGSLQYQLTAGSNLVIFNQREAVPPALQGIVSVAKKSKTVPIAIASGAAAAAIITTVALVRRSPSAP